MRILLTGSTGFLGSALARHWVRAGHELCLLLRPSSATSRLEGLLSSVTLIRANGVNDVMDCVRNFAPDTIVHTACSYGRAGESMIDVLDVNVRIGVALLQAVLTQDKFQAIFINTGTVLAPEVSLYALTKNQFSQLGASLVQQQPGRLQFINVRLQQMYGAGDDGAKFTTHVIEACCGNAPQLALTSGEQRRDFIHIDDVVAAYDVILSRHDQFSADDVIDIGSGEAVRIRDFVELVQHLTKASTLLEFGVVPYRPTEAMFCVADTTRLRRLGWTPRFDLEAGLRHTIAAFSSP